MPLQFVTILVFIFLGDLIAASALCILLWLALGIGNVFGGPLDPVACVLLQELMLKTQLIPTLAAGLIALVIAALVGSSPPKASRSLIAWSTLVFFCGYVLLLATAADFLISLLTEAYPLGLAVPLLLKAVAVWSGLAARSLMRLKH